MEWFHPERVLSERECADIVDQVPALLFGEGSLESGHDRAGIALADPFEELAIRMEAGQGMLGEI
jgi:hypothetical protein